MYTLDYSLDQLERLQDLIDSGHSLRIWHILTDSDLAIRTGGEDRYIVVIDCSPETYTLLLLL